MPDRAETEKFIRDGYEARRRGDLDESMAAFRPDAVYRVAGDDVLGPFTKPVRGADAIKALFAEFIRDWDWSEYEVRAVLVDGDRVAVHSSGRMLYTPAGRAMQTETVDLITLRDGKIAEFLQFIDTYAVVQTRISADARPAAQGGG